MLDLGSRGRGFESYLSHYFHSGRKNKRKEGKDILLISKKTAQILNKKYGVPFGYEGISTSKTSHKKYYLCESDRNLSLLKQVEK